jgi:hypothetical protein
MDNPLIPSQQDKIIEDALRSYPASPIPRDITGNVLARIQEMPAPRLQFTRNDFILTVVLTLVISAILFGIRSLPPQIILQLRIQGILLWQDLLVNARWLAPSFFFGLAALLAALTFPSLYKMTMDHGR